MDLEQIEKSLGGMRESIDFFQAAVKMESLGGELGAEEESEIQQRLKGARDAVERARKIIPVE